LSLKIECWRNWAQIYTQKFEKQVLPENNLNAICWQKGLIILTNALRRQAKL
jgi:hypothetical protein